MNRDLSIHEAAEEEIDKAASYYEQEQPGLGGRFLDELERAFDLILLQPESSPLIRRRVRRKILQGFPYSIIYSVRPHSIRILAVTHQKRRPWYWIRRS